MHIQAIKRFGKIRPKDLEMKKIEENLMLSTWHLSDDVRPSIEIKKEREISKFTKQKVKDYPINKDTFRKVTYIVQTLV